MRKRIASFVVLLLAFCFVIAGCAQKNGNAESKNADREQASISSSDDTQNVSDSSNRAESNTDSTIANAPNDIYAKSAWTAVQYSETSDGNYEDVMSIYCGVALFFDEGRATLITYDMQTEFGYTINTDGFTSPIGKTSMDAIIDNDSMTLKMLGHTWIMERTDISDAISYARTMVGPDYSGIPFENDESDSVANSTESVESEGTEASSNDHFRKPDVVYGRCDGEILSFSVPEDDYWTGAEGLYVLYMEPSETYKQQIREHHVMNEYMSITEEEFNKEIDALCEAPVNFMSIFEDSQKSLEWFYDESVPDASTAAALCYKDYVDTGYEESDEVGAGRVGRYISTCDGQTMYVVWHVGSSSLVSWTTMYEAFIDSPLGTIVEIDYQIAEESTEAASRYVVDSIKFK